MTPDRGFDPDDDEALDHALRGYLTRLSDAPVPLDRVIARVTRSGRASRAWRRSRRIGTPILVAAASLGVISLVSLAIRPHGHPKVTLPASSGPASAATTTKTSASPGQPTPSRPTAQPPPVAKLRQARLTWSGAGTATVYVGQLETLLSTLGGQVGFRVDAGYRSAQPTQCVATVVVRGLTGTTGYLIAAGLPDGLDAAEQPPSQNLNADHGIVHQQIVVLTTAGTVAGSTFAASAEVTVDGATTATGTYTVVVVARTGNAVTLTLNGQPVQCTR